MKFEGIYTPIITPHTADGTIDKDAFAEVVEFLKFMSTLHCSRRFYRRILCADQCC